MRRQNILFIFVCLLSFCSFAFSQDKPVAIKVDEYNEKTEKIETFIEKIKLFLNKLAESPKTTKGFIAIPDEDFPQFENLSEQAKTILSKNVALKDCVELSKPVPVGYRPKRLPEKVEFWLIPLNAEKPYLIEIGCGLPAGCPDIEVVGADYVYDKTKTQLFSASIIGAVLSDEIKLKWIVSAGEIVKGEGSPEIEIDFSKVEVNEITVIFELEGFSDCQTKVEHKVKIVNNPK